MHYTNNHNLPEAIVRAARSDKYSRGNADISVTQLIDAPQIRHLREEHRDSLTMDVVDSVWSMLGTAVHSLLEHSRDHVTTEERLYARCRGWVISGGVDVQSDTGIEDYKVTSVWAATKDKPEWERQLNCYAWLRRKAKGLSTKELHIWAILRDWNRSEAKRDRDYPQCPVLKIAIPVWAPAIQDAYVLGRVLLHQRAEAPQCSEEERWAEPPKWATIKPKGVRAKKVFDNFEAAEQYAISNGLEIVKRDGKSKRCEGGYCGVSQWCQQFKSMGHGGGFKEPPES